MAFNETLAARVRNSIGTNKPLVEKKMVEKKMFGGLTFMVYGHMCCGVLEDELMVRVGPEAYEEALAMPHARTMEFTGRPMKGMVFVGGKGVSSEQELNQWVGRGISFVESLPPK